MALWILGGAVLLVAGGVIYYFAIRKSEAELAAEKAAKGAITGGATGGMTANGTYIELG